MGTLQGQMAGRWEWLEVCGAKFSRRFPDGKGVSACGLARGPIRAGAFLAAAEKKQKKARNTLRCPGLLVQ